VFVYNSRDEYAPWQPATYDSQGQASEMWPPGSQPSYAAYAEFQAAELLRSSAQGSISLMFGSRDLTQPSSGAPVRSAILELAVTADTILFNKMKQIASTNHPTDNNQSKLVKEQLWKHSKKQFDIFSQQWLPMWFPFIQARDSNASEILGFTSDAKRAPWINLLERLRNRFIHRSPYFLEYDFEEMREYLELTNEEGCNSVFVKFIDDVAKKVHRLASLNTGS
jgi:hypothetical protein